MTEYAPTPLNTEYKRYGMVFRADFETYVNFNWYSRECVAARPISILLLCKKKNRIINQIDVKSPYLVSVGHDIAMMLPIDLCPRQLDYWSWICIAVCISVIEFFFLSVPIESCVLIYICMKNTFSSVIELYVVYCYFESHALSLCEHKMNMKFFFLARWERRKTKIHFMRFFFCLCWWSANEWSMKWNITLSFAYFSTLTWSFYSQNGEILIYYKL